MKTEATASAVDKEPSTSSEGQLWGQNVTPDFHGASSNALHDLVLHLQSVTNIGLEASTEVSQASAPKDWT